MKRPMAVRIEIFAAPGCNACAQARTLLKAVAEEFDEVSWREVDVVQEVDYAVALGILATPAIAIDGELVFASLPNARKLRAELARRCARDPR